MLEREEMPSSADPHAWIVVDHELLSRLGPAAPAAEWVRALKRTGLWELDGLDGAAGKELAEVRAAVAAGLVAVPPDDTPLLPARWTPQHLNAAIGSVALIALGVALVAGSPGWLAMALAVGLAIALQALLVPATRPRVLAPASWPVERATLALRRFLSRTFVTAAGDRIVENTPHRAYLELRLEELDRALRVADGRLAEIREVRARIVDANVRMGRAAEDVETSRLTAAIAEQEAARARVEGVRALLATRLADLEVQLDRLRVVVERQALSERVSRLVDAGARQDPVERVAADVEVDVAEIEGRVRSLALEAGDADARLRAVLEVVSVRAAAR